MTPSEARRKAEEDSTAQVNRIRATIQRVVGGVTAILAVLLLYYWASNWVSSPAAPSTPEQRVYQPRPDPTSPCTEEVQRGTLTQEPKDLAHGGQCYVLVEQKNPGECMAMFDRWGKKIATNCKRPGEKPALRPGDYGTFFAAVDQEAIEVVYITCREGIPARIAKGCPRT